MSNLAEAQASLEAHPAAASKRCNSRDPVSEADRRTWLIHHMAGVSLTSQTQPD